MFWDKIAGLYDLFENIYNKKVYSGTGKKVAEYISDDDIVLECACGTGATGMIADPTGKAMGMDAMLPYFQKLPFADVLFQDFLFSGFALLIVNGISNLTAAGFLFANRKVGVMLGGIFGVTLMLWICIQFYMFPLNFISTIYFVFGLCKALTGYAAWKLLKMEI